MLRTLTTLLLTTGLTLGGWSQVTNAAQPLAESDTLFPNVYVTKEGRVFRKSQYILNGKRVYQEDFKCLYGQASRYCILNGSDDKVVIHISAYNKLPKSNPRYLCSNNPQDWKYVYSCSYFD